MRRQVLEMEQDLARENEAAGIAALTAPPSLSTDALSKNSNGQPQSPAGSQGVAQGTSADGTADDDADSRSIYVGNVSSDGFESNCLGTKTHSKVDYASTPEEIQAHFASCGTINRVTILLDKFTGHPKGYARSNLFSPESHR